MFAFKIAFWRKKFSMSQLRLLWVTRSLTQKSYSFCLSPATMTMVQLDKSLLWRVVLFCTKSSFSTKLKWFLVLVDRKVAYIQDFDSRRPWAFLAKREVWNWGKASGSQLIGTSHVFIQEKLLLELHSEVETLQKLLRKSKSHNHHSSRDSTFHWLVTFTFLLFQ